MRENDLPNKHPSVGGSLLVLGKSLLAQNKPKDTKPFHEECLALREKTLPEDHYLLATTSIFLGECLLKLNEKEKGKRLLFESYENLKEKLGEDHEQTNIALTKIKEFYPSVIV